jgi:uncharacterized protein (TIGR03435 family)
VLLAVMAAAAGASAQSLASQSPESLAFDVVSIKPVAPGRIPLVVGASCQFRAGVRFRCPAITVKQLMSRAFRIGDVAVPQSQIVGGPDWLATSQFNIEASLDRELKPEELAPRLPVLLRQILEDRFDLKTHFERRPRPVYTLVRASEDGRLGPQLRQATTDCPPVPGGNAPGDKTCWGGSFQLGSIRAGAITMERLAAALTNQGFVDRFVVDRTDLVGKFDVDLRWSSRPLGAGLDPRAANADLLNQPSIFTAVQEQLGLKLEPRTEDMDVLVIDQVQQPSPN